MMTYDELKNIEINVLINGYMHRYDDKEFVKQCFLNGDGLKNDYESAKEDYESGDKEAFTKELKSTCWVIDYYY
jgi:hypothetical protein